MKNKFEPGSVVVSVRDASGIEEARKFFKENEFTIDSELKNLKIFILAVPVGTEDEVVDLLLEKKWVRAAHRNRYLKA